MRSSKRLMDIVQTGRPSISYCQKRYKYPGTGSRGFYFPDKKMGREEDMSDEHKMSTVKQMSEGLEIIKRGLPKWKKDFYGRLNFDENFMMEHNDFEYFTKFNSNTVKQWSVTSDAEASCGKSSANLTTSPSGKGLFCGYLNLEPVQDGYTKKSGFCNISAPPNKVKTLLTLVFMHGLFRQLHYDIRNVLCNFKTAVNHLMCFLYF